MYNDLITLHRRCVRWQSETTRVCLQAIAELKDSCLLYTSRAQALLKLKRPADALKDLDLALRLNESSLRAWIHKGKAHVQLGEHTQAVESFQTAIKLHPDQKSIVQGKKAILVK